MRIVSLIREALWPTPHPLPPEYVAQQNQHLATIRRASKAVAELRSVEAAARAVKIVTKL